MIPKWLQFWMGFADAALNKPPPKPPRKPIRYRFTEGPWHAPNGHQWFVRVDATDEEDDVWVEYLEFVNRVQLGQLTPPGPKGAG